MPLSPFFKSATSHKIKPHLTGGKSCHDKLVTLQKRALVHITKLQTNSLSEGDKQKSIQRLRAKRNRCLAYLRCAYSTTDTKDIELAESILAQIKDCLKAIEYEHDSSSDDTVPLEEHSPENDQISQPQSGPT